MKDYLNTLDKESSSRGSLTLEAALVLPLFLFYLILLYILSFNVRVSLLWHEAGVNAVKEFALLSCIKQDQLLQKDIDFFDLSSLKELPEQLIREKLSSAILLKRQEYWFRENAGDTLASLFIQEPRAYIKRNEGRLSYYFSWRQPTDPPDEWRAAELPLPYWGGTKFLNTALEDDLVKEEKLKDDEIWSQNELSRGRYFRETEGADLPFNYPVIASFQDNCAESIKSMDLTAPSYQDSEKFRKQLGKHATQLKNFSGADYQGRNEIRISDEEILSRKLTLVIPENSPAALMDVLAEEKQKLHAEGIDLEWVMRGRSSKYEEAGGG